MGYVALTAHSQPSNYSISHKRLEHSQTIVADSLTIVNQINTQCRWCLLLAFNPGFLSAIQNNFSVLLCGERSVSSLSSILTQLALTVVASCFYKSVLTQLNDSFAPPMERQTCQLIWIIHIAMKLAMCVASTCNTITQSLQCASSHMIQCTL